MPVERFQITKKKIRAPSEHGQALVLPPLSQVESIWSNNLNLLRSHHFEIDDISIDSIRTSARARLIKEAVRYTSQYRDTAGFGSEQIILSGHQPRLFHPGVWFKNFALSALGQSLNANSINMIVDNDLCGLSSISVPQKSSPSTATTKTVAYDSPGGNLPFEMREIVDREQFNTFAKRLVDSNPPFIKTPLVNQLWENVKSFTDPNNRLGNTLAAARHRLEGQHGLQTLEIPLSTICQSPEFASFTASILSQIIEFQSDYNESLDDYRKVHGIRSSSHPVPKLTRTGKWYETPFWIWSKKLPLRRALYLSQSGNQFVLSNLKDMDVKLDRLGLAEQIHELAAKNIFVRPRALITTMYSRMVLSDLFIHGIGGSKYDQLTDALITRFWKCAPPEFLTMTATMKLPFEYQRTTKQDLLDQKRKLRDLEYHPENHIASPNPSAIELIHRKRTWIENFRPEESNKQRHDAISNCSEQLQPYVASMTKKVQQQYAAAEENLARTRVLDSRAYSFCCFDESLVEALKSMIP